jgi:hypothetical protein
VSDTDLRCLVRDYGTTFYNRVDDRRVGDIGLLVMPLRTSPQQVLPEQGTFALSMNLTYVCWPRSSSAPSAPPQGGPGGHIMPAVSPDFPPFACFVSNIYDSPNT